MKLLASKPMRVFTALVLVCHAATLNAAEKKTDANGLEFFEKKIRPVLVKQCYKCHSVKSKKAEGGLLLDTREAIRTGGDSGHAVVPKNIKSSLLINAIRYKDFEMPPDQMLPDEVIVDFEKWVRMGAPDPRGGKMPSTVAKATTTIASADLWSLKPLSPTKTPTVEKSGWPKNEIDKYVLSKLEQAKLKPVDDAKPLILLRRIYFDLIGLPPPVDEIQSFQKNHSPQNFIAVVDRLLASPRFGERWARHWLDVARYAESNGKDRDVLMPHAWRYRDYVIDAINNDTPYNRFIVEQIAGDLLPSENWEERDRLQIATGFLAIGSKSFSGNLRMDLVDEQIDVIGKAVLGLTISCARCHDHKFDPVPTRDYYALAGIFLSTDTRYGGGLRRAKDPVGQLNQILVLGKNANQQISQVRTRQKKTDEIKKQRDAMQKQVQQLQKKRPNKKGKSKNKKNKKNTNAVNQDISSNNTVAEKKKDAPTPAIQLKNAKERLAKLNAQLKVAQQQSLLPKMTLAVGVRDAKKITDCKIHIRGEKANQGNKVPRGFLSSVTFDGVPAVDPKQSGRLQLAEWIVHPNNPLTARIAANRIWQHLFGRGIVETVDNFGANGIKPTHPKLLDDLASRFMKNGWSTKQLIREIVFSRTYQLSGQYHPANYKVDPGNTLYWRMSRRRLEAEALRDAMLSASNRLNLERPAASAVARIGNGEVGRGIKTKPLYEPFPHRSLYLPIIRGLVPEALKTFDFPEPSNVQGLRDTTNVPAQSLYLMNSPFVIEQSETLAKRVIDAEPDEHGRIAFAYQLCFGRFPSESEIVQAVEFLSRYNARLVEQTPDLQKRTLASWTTFCQALFASAEFRYID